MKIKEVFPTLLTDGSFFTGLITEGRFGSITAPQCGLLYVSNSGRKESASLVDVVIGEDETATRQNELQLALIIDGMFGNKWDRLYADLQEEYSPIENYDKHSEIESQDSGTDSQIFGQRQITNQNGQRQQTNEYGQAIDTVTNYKNAYDGGEVVNDRSQNNTAAHTDTLTNAQSTDVTTEATRTDQLTHGKKNILTEHTHGNIGVTTNAQMIEGEWALRQKNFLKMVFADIDELLTLKCYT